MQQIILTAEAFSSIIIAIIFYASVRESLTRGRKDKVFSLFVGLNLLMIIIDGVSILLDGLPEFPLPGLITSYLSLVGVYVVSMVFGEYLKLHITENGGDVGCLQQINMIYGIAALVITTVAAALGALFTYENGQYIEGEYYSFYLYSMVPMYALQFIMLLKNVKKIPMHDTVAFLCYSLMPVFMTGLEMLVPGLSLSLAAMTISVLLIYVTMQTGLHRAAEMRESVLREKSYTDELTGALNRRAYSERCDEIRADDRLKIAFCDINGLKYINDRYGHAEGDGLLRRVSNGFIRLYGKDSFFRISGDEFVVLDVNSQSHAFEDKLCQVREELKDMDYEPVAIGTAEGNGSELAALLTTAEEEMYAAKALFHRRNPQYVRGGELFIRDILDDSNLTETEPVVAPKTDELPKRVGSRSKILLLESSNEELRLLKGLLSENYDLIESSGIGQAMDLLRSKSLNVSLILLDVHLPEISGFEFLREIMKDVLLSTIPVILTSSEMRRTQETDYLRMGAFDCVRKPYSPDMLLNRIKRAIQLRESLNTLADVEFDELTGVYNRQAFFHYMRTSLQDDGKTAYDLTILDIPDFKNINKRFNEEKGNEVLKYIADQICDAMQDLDGQNGRYDADIFMIFTRHGEFDETKREALAKTIESGAPVEGLTVKFGVYENLPTDVAPSALYDLTMTVLRAVKHTYGVRTGKFDKQIQMSIDRERRLEKDMEAAIREEQFKVYYQPKFDARTGYIAGAEALVRWLHPQLGMIAPTDFVPLFERNGFIQSVDRYIWNRTCANLKRWKEEGLDPVPVSVNASRRDFNEPVYFEQADAERERNGVPTSLLHLEVTESALGERPEMVKPILEKWRSLGYLIEMDDFGTGYSSLGELGTLPLDIVKLDRTFVMNAEDPRGASVLNAGVLMAKKLGMAVLAEGVETEEQLALVRAADCDYIQGFYYSKPLSEEEFGEYLRNNTKR